MQIRIKKQFWILERDSERIIFDNETEAINELKKDIKQDKKSLVKMFLFVDNEQIEVKQVSWEQIAKQILKGD